jgi:hypothetical protein
MIHLQNVHIFSVLHIETKGLAPGFSDCTVSTLHAGGTVHTYISQNNNVIIKLTLNTVLRLFPIGGYAQ